MASTAARSADENCGWARGSRNGSVRWKSKRAGADVSAVERLERDNARIATLSGVLAVLAPAARTRKPELIRWDGGSRDERFTPPDLLAQITAAIGAIDLNPAAHPYSPVAAARYIYKDDDGLVQPWSAAAVNVNPPYSLTAQFIRRARRARTTGARRTILMLLPIQTQHQTFRQWLVGSADVLFLRGKIAFERPGQPRALAPFGNLIAIHGADTATPERALTSFDGVHLARDARVAGGGRS